MYYPNDHYYYPNDHHYWDGGDHSKPYLTWTTNTTVADDLTNIIDTAQALVKITLPKPIKRVIFHNPATVVYWQDGSKTVVKCKADEHYDKEKGLAMCLAKKLLGTEFHSTFKEWCKDAD